MRKIWGAAAVVAALFLAAPAEASKLFISECKNLPQIGTMVGRFAAQPCIDQAPVDFSGGSASSAAFAATTKYVRVVCDADCSILFGASPQTAAATNALLPSKTIEYFGVVPGQIVSVHANP
jgi:hypothetical protein